MRFHEQGIKGVYEIALEPHEDSRGFFMRTYDEQDFRERGLCTRWTQESHSFSRRKGTLRGIHFQRSPHAEAKLVRVALGEAFFVVLDLRKGSPTLGLWASLTLSGERRNALYVPKGCALGMCTLMDDCHLLYKIDVPYHPQSSAAIRWDDPELAIPWPAKEPVISERDAAAPTLREFLSQHGGIEQ